MALRLYWHEKPSFTSSLRTVSAPIGCPMAVRIAANLSMLFDTHSGITERGRFEETVLDPVPLRRSRRIMVHAERQVRLIGDRQFFHLRIASDAAHASTT